MSGHKKWSDIRREVAKFSCAECGDDYFPDEADEHAHLGDGTLFGKGIAIPTQSAEESLEKWLDMAEDEA